MIISAGVNASAIAAQSPPMRRTTASTARDSPKCGSFAAMPPPRASAATSAHCSAMARYEFELSGSSIIRPYSCHACGMASLYTSSSGELTGVIASMKAMPIAIASNG